MTALDRGCVKDQPQRSTLQRHDVNPMLAPLAQRLGLRWQSASDDTAFARTGHFRITRPPSPVPFVIRAVFIRVSSCPSVVKNLLEFRSTGERGKTGGERGIRTPDTAFDRIPV